MLENLKITELIGHAPWREAVTYRETWPHEYVLSRKDDQRELIELVCARFRAGEGVAGTFFGMANTYLFIGDCKYWLMTHWEAVDLDDGQDYVLNRARLYRDRRDFVIQAGDTGKHEDYPVQPARSMQRADQHEGSTARVAHSNQNCSESGAPTSNQRLCGSRKRK